jgi:hypothetical protein
MKHVAILIALMTLPGCRMMENQQKMDMAQEEYVACLKANPKRPANCESLKMAYLAYRMKDRDIHQSLQSMGNNSINVNHQIEVEPSF